MKVFFRFTTLIVASVFLAACGGNDSDGSNTDLTGQWRSESNNILYSIRDNNSFVEFNVCNDDLPFNLSKEDEFLTSDSGNVLKVMNESEMEFVAEGLRGIRLLKISSEPEFNNGSMIMESDHLEPIDVKSNLCAYRETDNTYIHIGVPYLNSFLRISIGIEDEASSGDLEINKDLSICLESSEILDGLYCSGRGTAHISEYTGNTLIATFEFEDDNGDFYNGSLDITF